jgi:hypothetical protein
MVRVVEARAQEVVHPGVGDEEALLAALLAVHDAREEDARGPRDKAAHLAQDLGPRGLKNGRTASTSSFGVGVSSSLYWMPSPRRC